MTRIGMSFLILITTVVVVFGFLRSDHTARAMVQFIALYLVGVVWPAIWSYKLHRALRPTDRRTSALAWSPVVVGSTTIVIGLATFV